MQPNRWKSARQHVPARQAEPRDDELERDADQHERHEDEDEEQRAEDHFLRPRCSERHGVELEPVVDQPVAQALGDDLLDGLDLLVAELDDLAGADVDQVVVVLVGDQLEARAAVLEVVLGDETGFLEEVDGAVDGRERDARIDLRRAAIELLDVGMVGGGLDDLRDDAALVGHPHAAGGALLLERLWVLGLTHRGLRVRFWVSQDRAP